ncbi:unnamed protein product, partial [Pylaiella littoralis]
TTQSGGASERELRNNQERNDTLVQLALQSLHHVRHERISSHLAPRQATSTTPPAPDTSMADSSETGSSEAAPAFMAEAAAREAAPAGMAEAAPTPAPHSRGIAAILYPYSELSHTQRTAYSEAMWSDFPDSIKAGLCNPAPVARLHQAAESDAQEAQAAAKAILVEAANDKHQAEPSFAPPSMHKRLWRHKSRKGNAIGSSLWLPPPPTRRSWTTIGRARRRQQLSPALPLPANRCRRFWRLPRLRMADAACSIA